MPIIDVGFNDTDHLTGGDTLMWYGPTIWVDIGFDTNFNYGDGGGMPESGAERVPALVDTGAVQSCIDEPLAIDLGLPLVDRQLISGVSGPEERNVYLAHIASPQLGDFQWGRFTGVSLTDGDQAHRALIGRTFLQNKLLVYDGATGNVTIAV